jgi:hypothetical protein
MDDPSEQHHIARREGSSEGNEGNGRHRHQQTYTFVLRPHGRLAKMVSLVIACALLALAFVFSLLIFALLAGFAIVMLAGFWWRRIRQRRK